MTHLTLEQLTQLREPGLEPGLAAVREHLAECAECRAEQRRLDQRIARLRALPSLRPSRDHWAAIKLRVENDRRRRIRRWAVRAGAGAVLVAASLTLLVMGRNLGRGHARVTTAVALDQVMARSSALEQSLQAYNPDARILDGTTAGVAGELEDRIAVVDQQLQAAQMLAPEVRDNELLRLWRERVGLLDALMDVHLTRASHVGM